MPTRAMSILENTEVFTAQLQVTRTRKPSKNCSTTPVKAKKRTRTVKPPARVAKPKARPRASAPQPTSVRVKHQRIDPLVPGVPRGAGTKSDPIAIPLRLTPNDAGCLHCPIGINQCLCAAIDSVISQALERTYATTAMRRTHAFGRSPLNSKSVLPVFVTRILRLTKTSQEDTFWDLGCGIGTVVMQAALQHGADAVGIDIQPENIAVAEQTWALVQKEWTKRYPERHIGNITFIAGDMFAALESARNKSMKNPPTTVWMSNQLFTPQMNHQLADFMASIPSIRAVAAMLDLFPHERVGITQKRNPLPYERFPVMRDHMTQENALEWSATEERPFYIYAQRD